MKTIFTILSLLLATASFGQFASAQFEFNNFGWHQNTDGRMFHDRLNSMPGLEVPLGSDIHALFSSSLWLSGERPDGSIAAAAQTYCQSNNCVYTPGPLKTDGSGESDMQTEMAFDVFWRVSRDQIETHIAYYDCLNDPNCDTSASFPDGYEIPWDLNFWPAHGDTSSGYAAYIAPFTDYNDDGLYNPEDGDTPLILGDYATFSVAHTATDVLAFNGGVPAEIHTMVYGFDSEETALQNTLFVQHKVIHRGAEVLSDMYLSIFDDYDLGNPFNDLTGTDVARSMTYVYNGTDNDADTPAVNGYGEEEVYFGTRILAGPLRDADGIDNAPLSPDFPVYGNQTIGWGDGVPDNERLGLAYSLIINNTGAGAPPATTDPGLPIEYFQMMRGRWKDGSPLTFGGSGYNPFGEEPLSARYIYPGASDPLAAGTDGTDPEFPDAEGWTEVTADNPPGDRRMIASSGPFTFSPGDVQYLDYAYVFASETTAGDGDVFEEFLSYADQAATADWGGQLPDFTVSVRSVAPEALGFELYPNPAVHTVTLSASASTTGRYTLHDLTGRTVLQGTAAGPRTEISVGHLPKGMYLLRYETEGEAAVKKLVVE